MSCLTTSATRRSRIVPAAVLIASAAASSHDVLLVPMTSVTRYTLMTLSSQELPTRAPRGPVLHIRPGSWPGPGSTQLPQAPSLALCSGNVQAARNPAVNTPTGKQTRKAPGLQPFPGDQRVFVTTF